MLDIADFAPLLSHPRFTEKLLLAERIRADAIARKQSADEACNNRLRARSDRRVTIQRLLEQSRATPRRAENHQELEAELLRLAEGDRSFQREVYADRQRAEEEYGGAMGPADGALNWLDEQLADWRASGKRNGSWLRHVAAPLKGKKASVELVSELRANLEEIERQVLDVRRRPATKVELKASLDATLSEVASLGRLYFDPRQRRADPFGLLDKIAEPHVILPVRGSVSGASALLIAVFEPELRQHFHEQIEVADLPGAMSDDQQERELIRLSEKRLGLERVEEAVVCALEEQGVALTRRPGLDPRAFLEVEER
jgi:hypothetical protein